MSFAITAIVAGSALVITQTAVAIDQNNKAKKKANEVADHEKEIKALEANRQAFINPYENLANEFANIGVATGAAKFQAEEADIALANTLDTLMATGAGAGGATALAQAALKSKMGISNNIQQQEAQNEKLRAQGEMNVQKQKAEGEKWKWAAQEGRELQKLNREQGLLEQDLAMEMQHRQNATDAVSGMTDVVGDVFGMAMGNADQFGT